MAHLDSQTIQLIIIAIAGLAVVMQAFILLAIFLSVKKGVSAVQEEVSDLRSAVVPLIKASQDFLSRVAPKIEMTTTDVADMVHGLRVRSVEMETSTGEILDRVQRQTARIDTMLTLVLDSVERAGIYVAGVVDKPVRQLSGIVAAIRVAVETLRRPQAEPGSPHHSDHQPGDNGPLI
jgi:hypothetical protein